MRYVIPLRIPIRAFESEQLFTGRLAPTLALGLNLISTLSSRRGFAEPHRR
jgi:hypothetical protein